MLDMVFYLQSSTPEAVYYVALHSYYQGVQSNNIDDKESWYVIITRTRLLLRRSIKLLSYMYIVNREHW